MRFRLKNIIDSPVAGHWLIGSVFLALGLIFVCFGITPVHDAVGWYGAFHYFYVSVSRGIIPFWNPYAMAGTPFYPNFQLLGLWEPSNYFFAFVSRLTGYTLYAYLFHYLFYYFVFVAGTYNTIRAITKRNDIGLFFSLIVLLGIFPAFMHQNGAMHSFWLAPLCTYFVVKHLEAEGAKAKGFYFYCAAFALAIACLVYIPSGMIFYAFWFVLFAAAFKMIRMRDMMQFVASRPGLVWIGISMATFILIVLPVAILYFDSKVNNELFSFVRLQLSTLHALPKLFASDINTDIFSQNLTATQSITRGNLVGFLLEPWVGIKRVELLPSEIIIYMGMLPVVCVVACAAGLRRTRNPCAPLFMMMCVVTLLVMSNLKTHATDPLSFFQRLFMHVVPALNKIEVFENFGALFCFCFAAAAAIGFKWALESHERIVWLAALFLLFVRYCLAFAFFAYMERVLAILRFFMPGTTLHLTTLMYIYLGVLAIASVPLWMGIFKLPLKGLRTISILLLFADLITFNVAHIKEGIVLERDFYSALKQEGLLKALPENQFINYREPFIKTEPRCIIVFWGHEILMGKKVAMPGMMNDYFNGCRTVDSTFSTQSYYDYLVNVRLDGQLAASGVIYPIVNFYESPQAIVERGKYEIVRCMNQMTARELGRHIFLDSDPRTSQQSANVDYSRLFESSNYLRFAQRELDAFEREKTQRFQPNRGFDLKVLQFDPNHLFVRVSNAKDGYLYFSDGYSKYWNAFVDGQKTMIKRADVNFKAIDLPHGTHRVAFIYDPIYMRYAIYASIVGSLVGMLLIAAYLVMYTSRRNILNSPFVSGY